MNAGRLAELSDADCMFETEFFLPSEELAHRRLELRFEGLDTLCAVLLNGREIGRADNMHRRWTFSVKGAVRPGQNRLELHFSSPLRYMRECQARHYAWGDTHAADGIAHIRKASYISLHPEQEETAVSISNETMVAVDGYIELLVMDAGLRILHRERHACRVPGLFARDVLRFAHLPWVGVEPRSRLLVCRLYDGAGTLLTECAQIYTAHRFFRYQNPVLQCRAEVQDGTLFVLVRGGAFASGVEIRSDRAELVLEDNDFDLTATAWRPIRVLRMDPALSAAELESSLTVRSVYDIGRPDR